MSKHPAVTRRNVFQIKSGLITGKMLPTTLRDVISGFHCG
jgi:hypothetical protein